MSNIISLFLCFNKYVSYKTEGRYGTNTVILLGQKFQKDYSRK